MSKTKGLSNSADIVSKTVIIDILGKGGLSVGEYLKFFSIPYI